MPRFAFSGMLKVSGQIEAPTQAEAWAALVSVTGAELVSAESLSRVAKVGATFHDGQPLELDRIREAEDA